MAKRPPIAELIVDSFVGHDVNLQRLAAGEQRVIFKMLGQLQKELIAALTTSDLDEKYPWQRKRYEALRTTVKKILESRYKNIAHVHQDRLIKIAETVSEQTLRLTNAKIGASLLTVGVPLSTLKALANDKVVEGLAAQEWWTRQRDNLRARFMRTIRQGMFAGETLGELVRRVRGKRELRFKDGIMAITTREAEALIRTSLLSVANAARYETYQANDDVLLGQQWLSVLDSRTTQTCMALSGQAWDLNGRPIGNTKLPFPGFPPIHWNCRSSLTPILKSWEQLAREAKGNEKLAKKLDKVESAIDKGTQASMDGEAAGDLTFEGWLKQRSEDEQKEILGPGRWGLWQKGQIGLTDLVDQHHRPLTLEELKASVA